MDACRVPCYCCTSDSVNVHYPKIDSLKFAVIFFFILLFLFFGLSSFFFNDFPSSSEQFPQVHIKKISSTEESGTERLQKGQAVVNVEKIGSSSVILLSRKTIKGTPGSELVIDDIDETSQSFTITSMKDGEHNEKDNGLICWVKIN